MVWRRRLFFKHIERCARDPSLFNRFQKCAPLYKSAARYDSTYATEADDAKRLALKLYAYEALALPAPGSKACDRLRNAPRHRHQKRQRMLGCRHGIAVRRIHDDNAARRSSRHIYVV